MLPLQSRHLAILIFSSSFSYSIIKRNKGFYFILFFSFSSEVSGFRLWAESCSHCCHLKDSYWVQQLWMQASPCAVIQCGTIFKGEFSSVQRMTPSDNSQFIL